MSASERLPDGADVVVVGGGIMGASTTYFLARESDREVLLLEKDAIASGSTGDSSAIVRHHYGDQEIYSRMAKWSHEFYRDFEERTGESIAYAENPMVRYATEDGPITDYLRAGYEILSELDLPATELDDEAVRERYPMLELDPIEYGVSDDSAAYSDGTDAAGGFARAAQDAGATVVTGVAVEGFEVADGAIAGVETDAGTVAADELVLTAGPWTPALADDLGIEVPIEPSREQVLLLDPPPAYEAAYEETIPTTGPPGGNWYLRPDFAGGVLVATHHSADHVDPDTYDPDPDEDVILELIEAVSAFVPELADAKLRGQYCGVYSDTPDHDFVVGPAGPEGCYLGCGFSGHGFKHGPAVGRILRDLVVDGETDLVDAEYFSLDRFADDPHGHGKPEDNI